MLSGRRKKDYEAQQAAEALVAQAEAYGECRRPSRSRPTRPASEDDDEEDEEAA